MCLCVFVSESEAARAGLYNVPATSCACCAEQRRNAGGTGPQGRAGERRGSRLVHTAGEPASRAANSAGVGQRLRVAAVTGVPLHRKTGQRCRKLHQKLWKHLLATCARKLRRTVKQRGSSLYAPCIQQPCPIVGTAPRCFRPCIDCSRSTCDNTRPCRFLSPGEDAEGDGGG